MYNTILFSLIIIFIYIFLFQNNNNVVYVESATGAKFLVNNSGSEQYNTADLLSTIVENLFKLKNHLYTNINNYPEYREYIKQLNENLTESRTLIYETDPSSGLTSYSVNKGEELSFCLKSKKTGELH